MTSLQSMIKKLSPLEIYSLNESSLVYAELAAFAVGLDLIRRGIEELLQEGFVATAEDYGIENCELLVGSIREDLSISKRREMLLQRSALDSGDFTLEGFEQMLKILGVEGEIEESPLACRIAIKLAEGNYTSAQREWIVSQAREFLPAHLEWDVVFAGFCWEVSDVFGYTFVEIESKGYSWKEIDYLI